MAGGGGVFVLTGGEGIITFTMHNGTISHNITYGDGGGIWTDFRPERTTTGPNVIFYRNEARRAVVPPEPPLANIQFTRSSIIGDYGEFIHLLNNYDINFFLHDVDPSRRVLMNLVELTYDANGGTGGPHLVGSSVNAWIRADSVHTVLTCSAADITAPPGYGFAGWNTAADGSGRFYAAGSEIALDDTIPLDGNITLFAQWARHTVTFDLDGGAYSGNQALLVQTVPHGQNATALSVNPTRNGYTFTGWAPALNLTNVTENRTFVAQWTPGVNHTVTFALNGGTYNGNQALLVQTVPHGQNATALSGNPSRPGFTFIGWAPALNLENVTENRTFVAQWRLIQGPQPTPTPPGNGDLPQREAFLIGVGDAGYPIPINPRGNITRAEVATIFFRLVEDEVRYEYWAQENPFDDVALEQWFNNAVSTTTNLGLFEGIGDDLFAPLNNITRGELAAVLVRFMERDQIGPFETSDDADDDLFNDIADHWARAYINRAAEAGWIEGAEGLGGPFRPGDPLERAEAAAMINRMFERLIETPDCRLYDMVTWPDNQDEEQWYFLYMYMATNSYRYRWRTDSDRYKELVQIIEPREWWRLERPDSVPADIFIRS